MNEIMKDVWHMPNALTFLEQKSLVKLYLKNISKFYTPKLANGYNMKLEMFCYGKHWNPIDYKYYDTRVDFDSGLADPIPEFLKSLINKFSISCFPKHTFDYDICIINHYNRFAKLGLHKDNSESKSSIDSGHPVASISIGADCKFLIGGLNRSDPTKWIILKSGDILLFGDSARLIYHGVSNINSKFSDPFIKFINGRLNLTLRKY